MAFQEFDRLRQPLARLLRFGQSAAHCGRFLLGLSYGRHIDLEASCIGASLGQLGLTRSHALAEKGDHVRDSGTDKLV